MREWHTPDWYAGPAKRGTREADGPDILGWAGAEPDLEDDPADWKTDA